LIPITVMVTRQEFEILEKLTETLRCSRAAAMRLLIDVGSQHLEIRG